MELWGQIADRRILPEHNSDYDKLVKLRPNTSYLFKITQPRNVGFHKKFFALINLIFDNQETFNNIDELRYWITIKSGHIERISTPDGELIKPKSISFSGMDQIEFEKIYSDILDVACSWLDLTNEEVEREIVNFM